MDMLRMPTTASSSRANVRRTVSLFALAFGLIVGGAAMTAQAFSLGHLPGYFIPQQYFKHGAVYTRAIVLNESGKPTWVEYDSSGKEGREIGEAVGQYATAKVMAGDTYRAYLKRQTEVRALYPDAQVMTDSAYRSRAFKTVTGQTIDKPDIDDSTLTVMVRADKDLFSTTGKDLVLLEMPIKDGVTPDASSKSLLLATDGSILHQSANSIAFRVGFFGKDGQVATKTSRDRDAKIYGPMSGVVVGVGGWGFFGGGVSDKDGKYSFSYWLPPCPGFDIEFTTPLTLELRYKRFSPRGSSMMPYYMSRPDYDYCNGLGVWDLNAANIIATAATPVKPNLDFPVDLMVLDASAKLKDVKVGGSTTYNAETSDREHFLQEKYDFDGDEKPDFVVPGKKVKKDVNGVEKEVFVKTSLEEAQLQGIYLSSKYSSVPENTEEKGPDFTRLIDTAPDFKDRGLLKDISEKDLKDTDIYVFRESTGQLVAERRGLKDQELNNSSGLDSKNDAFRFTIQLRGSVESLYNDTARGDANFKKWQSVGGFKDEFQKRTANHLKAGENVRLIAINRPTGYVGSKVVQLKTGLSGNAINLNTEVITLKAPNLKIWAERKNKIDKGSTKGTEKKQLIGNEGAGLGSDVSIAIYTDWRDADGTALPEELGDYGYTGRLAKIVAANQLAPVGANNLSQFKIKPGQQVQVIQLPEKVLAKQHLYLQVAGQPESRNPDFSSDGSGSGILKYRPTRYVPVKVALHDEEASELARQAYRKATNQFPEQTFKAPQPIYSWQYRPEMQFSLYELNVNQVRAGDAAGTIYDLTDEDKPEVWSSDQYFGIVYDLIKSSFGTLESWGHKGERELVFSFGGEEIKAKLGEAQNIQIEDVAKLASATAVDFLSLRIYANNDAGNMLWEYVFNTELVGEAPKSFIDADDRNVDLVAYLPVAFDENNPRKVKVLWTVSDGGSLSSSVTESNKGIFTNTLTASTKAGAVHVVTAKVIATEDARIRIGAQVEYAPMKVLAGKPTAITLTSDKPQMLSSGVDIAKIKGDIRDQYGNPVQEGTAVNWQMGYSGNLEKSDYAVRGDGLVTAEYKVGLETIPTDITLSAGDVTSTLTIEKKPLDYTLALSSSSFKPGDIGTVTVTLNQAPQSAMDIVWNNSGGAVSGVDSIEGTTAQAQFRIDDEMASDGHVSVNIGGVIKDLGYSITPIDPEGSMQFEHAAVAAGDASAYEVETLQGSSSEAVLKSTNATVYGKPGTTVTLSAGGFFTPNQAPVALFPMAGFDLNASGQKVALDTLGGLEAKVIGDVSWDQADSYAKPGSSMKFEGGHLVVADNDALDYNSDYYVNTRFKPEALQAGGANGGAVIVRKGSNRSSGYELSVVEKDGVARLQARVSTDQGDFVAVATAPIRANSWYLAGLQLKNGVLTVGLDAERVSVAAPGVPNNSGFANNLIIGEGFSGNINEIKIGQFHVSRGSLVLIDGEAEKQVTFDEDGKARVLISGGTAQLNGVGSRVGFTVYEDAGTGVAHTDGREMRYRNAIDRLTWFGNSMQQAKAADEQATPAKSQEGGVAVVDGQAMAEAIDMLKKAGKSAYEALKTATQFLFEMTSISDLYQLTKATYLWANNRFDEVDKIELAFAGIGVTLTIVTVAVSIGSGGTGAPGSIASMISVKGALKVLKSTLKEVFIKEPGQILKIGGTVARWSFELVAKILSGKEGREAAIKQLLEFKDVFIELIQSGVAASWNLLKAIVKSPAGLVSFIKLRRLRQVSCPLAANTYSGDTLYARLTPLSQSISDADAATLCGIPLEKKALEVLEREAADAQKETIANILTAATRKELDELGGLGGLILSDRTIENIAFFASVKDKNYGDSILTFIRNMENNSFKAMGDMRFNNLNTMVGDVTAFDHLLETLRYYPEKEWQKAFNQLAGKTQSNVRGIYGEARTFKDLKENPVILRSDGSKLILDPDTLELGKTVPVPINGEAKKGGKSGKTRKVLGVDAEAEFLDDVLVDASMEVATATGKLFVEIKNYTSKFSVGSMSTQAQKHFDSNILAQLDTATGTWKDGQRPHLHYEWMGDAFTDSANVTKLKDAVIKTCRDTAQLAELGFNCERDITFRILPELIVPLTSKVTK